MTKLTIAAAITAIAILVTAPFTLAQTAPTSDTAAPAASSRGYEMGPSVMYGQAQVQSQGPGQGPTRGGYGPSMMDGNGVGWMAGYGGMWVPILLVLVAVGLVVWVVKRKTK